MKYILFSLLFILSTACQSNSCIKVDNTIKIHFRMIDSSIISCHYYASFYIMESDRSLMESKTLNFLIDELKNASPIFICKGIVLSKVIQKTNISYFILE